MTYQVNEIFKTIQGEGFWAGRAAVFCRFSRCNLWTGQEKDRARAVCQFCDTNFVASTKYQTRHELADAIDKAWGSDQGNRMVVLTGGEPLLQVDGPLTYELAARGYYIAVETNGTIKRPERIDWLTVSPKIHAPLIIHKGDELKLVYPQGPDPSVYLGLKFDHYWVQPMDGPDIEKNTAAAVEYVKNNPQWRLSLQTHKLIGMP